MELYKVDTTSDNALAGAVFGIYNSANIRIGELKTNADGYAKSGLLPYGDVYKRQLLDEAMIKTYASFGITHENTSLVDEACPERFRPMPKLGDLHQELLKSPQTRRLANILNRLCLLYTSRCV